jgi:RimJ/RimL family protein N-acetyltransferase
VRAASFSSDPIPWENHQRWFASRLADTSSRLYVISTVGSEPIGQVRFEKSGDNAVVSTSLDARFRGCGLASEVLRMASERFESDCSPACIHAYIRDENGASLSAFESAGYARAGRETLGNALAWRLDRFAGKKK